MTPFRFWFTQVEPGRWIPRSRGAWALTVAIVAAGIILSAVSPEQERWAEALAVERTHGAYGAAVIAERIGALALAGDEAGVERWKAIAQRYDQLLAAERSRS